MFLSILSDFPQIGTMGRLCFYSSICSIVTSFRSMKELQHCLSAPHWMDVPIKVILQYLIGCPTHLVNAGIFEFKSFAKVHSTAQPRFNPGFHWIFSLHVSWYCQFRPYSPVHVGIPTSFNSVFQFERKFFNITQTKRSQRQTLRIKSFLMRIFLPA